MFVVCLTCILLHICSALMLVRGTIQVLCDIAMIVVEMCVDVCLFVHLEGTLDVH